MAEFTVHIDDADIRKALTGLAERARNLRPAMETIGEMLQTSTDRRFETETDPDGKKWTPLAKSTLKAKAKAGHEMILQWSGRLRRSVNRQANSNSVTLGTNIVYAAIQQLGGTINHGGRLMTLFRSQKGIKNGDWRFVPAKHADFASDHWKGQSFQTIPARPFLGINAADRDAATKILRDYVVGLRAATP